MSTAGPNENPPPPRPSPPPPPTVAERAAALQVRDQEIQRVVVLGLVAGLIAIVAGTIAAVMAYPTLSADDGDGIVDGFGSLGQAYGILVGLAFASYFVVAGIGLVVLVSAGRRLKPFMLLMIATLPGPALAVPWIWFSVALFA